MVILIFVTLISSLKFPTLPNFTKQFLNFPNKKRTYLFTVLHDVDLVLLAGGLVIKIGGPFALRVHELVVEQPAQLVALLFRADHRHHRLMAKLIGLGPILKKQKIKSKIK